MNYIFKNLIMTFVMTSLLLISCNSKPAQKEKEMSNNISTVENYLALKTDPCKDIIRGTDTISILATKLRKLYNEQNNSSQNVVEFFKLFPTTFDIFVQIYGYDDKKGRSPLYSCNFNHIDYIYSTDQVSENEKLGKFINIGVGFVEKNNDDTQLSICLMELIKKNSIVTATILNKYSQKEVSNLWSYVFGGPHPNNYREDFNTIYNSMKKGNPTQAKLMKQEYERLLREEEPHGR